MRKSVKELEYRNYLGLDTRQDRSLVPPNYQFYAKNLELIQGTYQCRPGNAQWGTLDHSAISGTLHKMFTVDVGADIHVLMHKGTKVYYGLKDGGTYSEIFDLNAAPFAVADVESFFVVRGKEVGSGSNLSLKVIMKQPDDCFILEWDGSDWIIRNIGIENDFTFIASDTGGGDAPGGTYFCRVVAQRIVNGVRVNESAPVYEDGTGTPQANTWQEIEVEDNGRINVQVEHPGADDQITHYMLQVTKNLVLTADKKYSTNGNLPTLFFESEPVEAAAIKAAAVAIDVNDLKAVAPNLIGYLTIPGHTISVQTGGLLFFGGVGEFKTRIYKSGISGYYYHNELYDPFEFFSAGEDDGQELLGLGLVQDHLTILKEGKTGIVANHNIDGKIVWRDEKLGIRHMSNFDNISEDEMIVYNQDGIFRIFDGIRYSKEQTIADNPYLFSEKVREFSQQNIPAPYKTDFVFHDEKLHVIYDYGVNDRRSLSLFPREGMGWSNWENLTHHFNMLIDEGNTWLYENEGLLYEQSNILNPVYVDAEGEIQWEVHFANLHSQVSRKNKILVKIVGVEGDFLQNIECRYIVDDGRVDTGWQQAFPNPLVETAPWYQLYIGPYQLGGNTVELRLRGTGYCKIRGIYWGFIEKRSGNLGWSNVQTAKPTQQEGVFETGFAANEYEETGFAPDNIDEGDETPAVVELSETGSASEEITESGVELEEFEETGAA